MGPKWNSNLDLKIQIVRVTNTSGVVIESAHVSRGTGQVLRFLKQADGSYLGDADISDRLSALPTGGFLYQSQQQYMKWDILWG